MQSVQSLLIHGLNTGVVDNVLSRFLEYYEDETGGEKNIVRLREDIFNEDKNKDDKSKNDTTHIYLPAVEFILKYGFRRVIAGNVEYEQIFSTAPNLVRPSINNVNINDSQASDGIYKLSIKESEYTVDRSGVAFFFFRSPSGVFSDYKVNYNLTVEATFKVDEDVSGDIPIEIGLGDSLGRSYFKTIILN